MNKSTNQYYGPQGSLFGFVHSFILLYVLQQVHILFQSEFSAECNLLLPLSNPVSSAFLNPLDYTSKRTLQALAA